MEVWFKKFTLAQRFRAKARQCILKEKRGKQGEAEQSNIK